MNAISNYIQLMEVYLHACIIIIIQVCESRFLKCIDVCMNKLIKKTFLPGGLKHLEAHTSQFFLVSFSRNGEFSNCSLLVPVMQKISFCPGFILEMYWSSDVSLPSDLELIQKYTCTKKIYKIQLSFKWHKKSVPITVILLRRLTFQI